MRVCNKDNDSLLLLQNAAFLRKQVAVTARSGCGGAFADSKREEPCFLIVPVLIQCEDGVVISNLKQGLQAEYYMQLALMELPELLIIQLLRFTSVVRTAPFAVKCM